MKRAMLGLLSLELSQYAEFKGVNARRRDRWVDDNEEVPHHQKKKNKNQPKKTNKNYPELKLIKMKNSLTLILILISCLYSIGQINEDWEDNTWIGNWTMSNEIWEVGTHSSDSNPIFGNYCIGTIFGGNYPDDTESILISPSFEVPDISQNPYLRFWQWYSFSWNDNGTVMIKPDGGDWQPLAGPYIWNSSNTWSSPLISLAEFEGMTVQIGFRFYSNNHGSISNDVSSGWYIDNIELVTGEVVFDSLETFENDIGHWSFEGAWALGHPTSGPNGAHSGDNCFATNLAGNYGEPPSSPSAITNLLISPSFEVPDISQNPYLRFWQWYSFSWNDNGTVMIKPDGGDWQPLAGPYIWNSSNTWSSPLISLAEFEGMTVQIGFRFYSNNHSSISNDVSSGWYIDDVQLITGAVIFNSPEDFESGIGHWSAEGAWGLGYPTSGPNGAHSGENCFATNLAGNYGEPPSSPSAITNLLISPSFEVPDISQNPYLRFWQWYNFSWNDNGTVMIKPDGGDWQPLAGPYIWNSSNTWSSPLISLAEFEGMTVQIGFHFYSNNHSSISNDVSSGWYIDDVQLITGAVIFNSPEDFESGIGHWSAEGAWGLGHPTSGPNEAHSGDNCFATNLAGNYGEPPSWPSAIDDLLISPPFQIPDTAHFPRLGFWHWFNFSYNDYGEVLIKVEGGSWDTLMGPFTGTSVGGWRRPFVDLSPFIGETVQIAFLFHSNNHSSIPNDVSSGWYIDGFFAQDFLSLLPPEIKISKVGTTPVPGRDVTYFIGVENFGEQPAIDVEVGELLNPKHVVLKAVNPMANAPDSVLQNAYFIHWTIPEIAPNELVNIDYVVTVLDTVSAGTLITGGPCCTGENLLNKLINCLGDLALSIADCVVCIPECTACYAFCSTPTTITSCLVCLYPCFDCLFIGALPPASSGEGCAIDFYPTFVDCFKNGGNCDEDKQPCQIPIDPNEKLVNAKRFIQQNETLIYPIHFENVGTVEAIDVFITDTLDANLDLSTIEIFTPDGVSIDTVNRIVKWDLLGRNLQPQETDNVLLAIKPKTDLPSGAEIKNSAKINFDNLDSLLTNEVINIIDDKKPVSQMNPLPAITSDTSFSISWMGVDSIGEIDNYTIFVSIDGSEFTQHFLRISDTTAMYSGEIGKTYSFISIAEDIAGNIEEKLPIAEATTYIDPSVSIISPEESNSEKVKLLKQNSPNPFNSKTSIEYLIINSGKVKLEVFDVYGSKVNTLIEATQSRGKYSINWDGTNSSGVKLNEGMYFYRLIVDDYMEVKKMVLIR